MNLSTFRLRVQRTVGLAATTTGHDEQTLVDGWVNEAIEQFLLETKVFKKTASLALTADSGDYRLDADILAMEDLYINPGDGSQEYMLIPTDSWEVRRMRRTSQAVPGPTRYFAYEGQMVLLYPLPGSGDTLHIVYVARPSSTMSAADDDPSTEAKGGIPKEYHPTLEGYVKWKAAEYSNDAPSGMGEKYRQEWERGVIRCRILENRKAGIYTSQARVGRKRMRRLGVPVGNGVDLGG